MDKIQRALDESKDAKAVQEEDGVRIYLEFDDESYLSIRTSDGTTSEWDSKPSVF